MVYHFYYEALFVIYFVQKSEYFNFSLSLLLTISIIYNNFDGHVDIVLDIEGFKNTAEYALANLFYNLVSFIDNSIRFQLSYKIDHWLLITHVLFCFTFYILISV